MFTEAAIFTLLCWYGEVYFYVGSIDVMRAWHAGCLCEGEYAPQIRSGV